jgi:RNA polymerase sigma-70 factor (ECF subfamily)
MPPGLTSNIQEGSSSSASLVERLQAGDAQAWPRFAQLYGPLVYHWARRSGLQDSDAADLGQEVFQAVVRGVHAFRRDRPLDSFRGWLRTIVLNKIREHFRRRAERPLAEGGSAAHQQFDQIPFDDASSADCEAESSLLARRAVELIRQDFAETTWRAFWNTAIERQAAADVARELGLSVGAVYMAKSRVLARLRQELDEPPA